MVTYHIIVVVVKNKKTAALKLQEILTTYGNTIKTRVVINETKQEQDHGLVILHGEGRKQRLEKLVKELRKEKDLAVKLISIQV